MNDEVRKREILDGRPWAMTWYEDYWYREVHRVFEIFKRKGGP